MIQKKKRNIEWNKINDSVKGIGLENMQHEKDLPIAIL